MMIASARKATAIAALMRGALLFTQPDGAIENFVLYNQSTH
jgi:hypothetical protein